MSAHVLLNLLNELGKIDKMRGLPRNVIINRGAAWRSVVKVNDLYTYD